MSTIVGVTYSMAWHTITRRVDNRAMYGCFLLIHYDKGVYTEHTAYQDLCMRSPFVGKVSNVTYWIRTQDEENTSYTWALEE